MTPGDGSKPEERPGAARGLTQRALAGLFWTFSGTGLQVIVQLLVIVVLARLITPAEFGVMGAATVVIALSQIVSQVGVGPAIIQRRTITPAHIRVAVTVSGLLGLILGAAVWFGAPALAAFYRIPEVEPVLRWVAFLFPLDALTTVSKSLLVRQLRFRLLVALELGTYVVGYAGVGIVLAWYGYGVWALVMASLTQVSLGVVAMYLATRHPLRPSLDLRAGRELLSFGFGHSLAQIGIVVSEQGDNLVVGRWLGPTALGVYGRAYNLMVMPASAFGRVVSRVLFPVMAKVQDEPQRLRGAYERALAIVALISLPDRLVPLGRRAGVHSGDARTSLDRGRGAISAVHDQPIVSYEQQDHRCLHEGRGSGVCPSPQAGRIRRDRNTGCDHRTALGCRWRGRRGVHRYGHQLLEHGGFGTQSDGSHLVALCASARARGPAGFIDRHRGRRHHGGDAGRPLRQGADSGRSGSHGGRGRPCRAEAMAGALPGSPRCLGVSTCGGVAPAGIRSPRPSPSSHPRRPGAGWKGESGMTISPMAPYLPVCNRDH